MTTTRDEVLAGLEARWDDISEDDTDVVLVAHAIAEHGIGRQWDDFLPSNAYDIDHSDLTEYARAAVAALRAKAALRSSPIQGREAWRPSEREAVARAIFGDGWECCENLGPYMQSTANELTEARMLIEMFEESHPALVEKFRDLIEQLEEVPAALSTGAPGGGASDVSRAQRGGGET
jgi:hypothetical protein